ncbi:hypothetical protein ACFO26_02985 [Lactococcus nasutitermitis]|uniref:Uncharacterized protein n=1 Tax=Lactococcus nasutitermitis TaxID=1652957 RepID=A0ABV9JBS4_9LACT|nr:hypothetical protein [Lactococcus nasutitermitis]
MPWKKVADATDGSEYIGLVNATDEEIREHAREYSIKKLSEKEIQDFINDYRIREQKKLETEVPGTWSFYVIIKQNETKESKPNSQTKNSTSMFSSTKPKSKDKSATERYDLTVKIQHNEQTIDELSYEQRQVTEQLERTKQEITQAYQEREMIYTELASSSREIQNALTTTESMRRHFQRTIDEQSETVTRGYRQSIQKLDDERESLYQERNTLAW